MATVIPASQEYLTKELEHVELKVQLMAELLFKFRQENTALKEENIKLQAGLQVQKDLAGELAQRLSNTQRALARQRGDESESSLKLRKQIDKYITEIDQCIEWLQKA